MNNLSKEILEFQDEIIGNLIKKNKNLKKIVNTLLAIILLLIGVYLVLILNP